MRSDKGARGPSQLLSLKSAAAVYQSLLPNVWCFSSHYPYLDCSCRILSPTEADLFNMDTFCSQPKYYVPDTFPKFTVQPTSKIRDLTSDDPSPVTLNCEISPNAANFSIAWEHNGVPINDSSMYNGFDSSTLTIRRPSLVESEGRYRCRVDYQHGNFSMVSREAHFKTPREFNQAF